MVRNHFLLATILATILLAGCSSEPRTVCSGDDDCDPCHVCVDGVCQAESIDEVCGDWLDNDCDGQTDEDCSTVCEPGNQQACQCDGGEEGYQICRSDGSGWEECQCPCDEDCTGRECGPDPVCGKSCGECRPNEICTDGLCGCPFEVCGNECCGQGEACYLGACCVPDCQGVACGDDGCGGSCGSCAEDHACHLGECYPTYYESFIGVSSAIDILFMIDNSGTMVGEQTQLAESFSTFTSRLEEVYGDKYHIAVITTGMESVGCPLCDPPMIPASCMNETGENGRFQDLICRNEGSVDDPVYVCRQDATCRVVTNANLSCFYDESQQEGIALTGVSGCGYEKGLAPIRRALQDDLLNSYNSNFLRENAILAVVVVTDEEDCGEVGDVTENVPAAMGNICYFAAKGIGPEGETSHPDDPDGKPYQLTAVQEYYDFLMGLKDDRVGMVKFAAIVGVNNVDDLSTTTIEYSWNTDYQRWEVADACVTPGCTGRYCMAKPGTRYIELARMFGIGKNGFVDSICQQDFSPVMEKLGDLVDCPKMLILDQPLPAGQIQDIQVLLNGEAVYPYSCSVPGPLSECAGPGDNSCAQGSCVETWTYHPPTDPPDPSAPHGTISFSSHFDPCVPEGEARQLLIQVIYTGT